MSGPAVHFNIGVTSYRLGRLDRAEEAFEEVARTPAMAALAYYNLGLVATARNDSAAATRWFNRVERATDDARLRELAATRLAEMQPVERRQDWIGYASFGLGYDDNVALVSNANVLGIANAKDNFAELQLALGTALGDHWKLDGGLMATDYADLDAFDQRGAYGGVRYRWNVGRWTDDAGLRLNHSMLDGEGFENRASLTLQTGAELSPDLHFRARYRLHAIDGLNEYSGLSGLRHDVNTRLAWTRAAWNFGAEYQFEIADYDDQTLSARRHQLRLDVERAFGEDWSVSLEALRRRSDYEDDAYGTETRSDLALSLTRIIARRWRLFVRYASTENAADSSQFDYRGTRVSAGVEATL